MNTSHGWIKLYRCLLDDAVCQKSAYFHLWVTLLLMAAHKEHEFIFNNQIHTLHPGQLITGRKKLSKLTGIHESTIQRALKFLENAQMIEQQKRTKFRIITIRNWENFQSTQASEQQMNSTGTSTEQPRPHTRMIRMKRMITHTGVMIFMMNNSKSNAPATLTMKPWPSGWPKHKKVLVYK